MNQTVIQLGTKREMFWDDYLVDTSRTTAQNRLIQPIFRETVKWLDHPVEYGSTSYPCIVKINDGYLMYYVAWSRVNEKSTSNYCVLTSKDGIHWDRPSLGMYEYNGSKDNNIVIPAWDFRDNAFVFYDTNPNCPPEEKFKCLADGLPAASEEAKSDPNAMKRGLWYYSSPDGFHFTRRALVSICGRFDTMNTAHWDGKRYVSYIRNYHGINVQRATGGINENGVYDINHFSIPSADENKSIRDVRVMYSDDFIHWTEPKLIRFNDGEDYPLYTNVVSPYARAEHILVGFPTRYVERPGWSENFEQLAGREMRWIAVNGKTPREGLAITDCIFMWSRDGENWDRFSEAFMTPGYEREHNWVYGDCYPAYGLLDLGDENLSIYTIDYHRSRGFAKPVNRFEIRKDGFACYMAGGREAVLVTKPLTFSGTKLHLNMATSAFGYIYVDVLDEAGNVISPRSFEVFGDHIDRSVFFEDGSDFAPFAGKTVRLRFTMRDAKLFSVKFE